METTDQLFRHESGRITAALTRIFGTHNLELVHDVVQDAFCRAVEVWKFKGVPENPSAWLMMTAKNRALDALRRERTARTYAPEIGRLLESEWTRASVLEEVLNSDALNDDMLRMIFTCCDPKLAEVAQIALVLHILCGFSVNETAQAFICSHSAMEKRLTRAKQAIAESRSLFDLDIDEALSERLPIVRRALYLLFNEGYHGASPVSAIRREVCLESMRLTSLLLAHPQSATPTSYALAALMCFHLSRLPGRLDSNGQLGVLGTQDRSLWDRQMISDGFRLLEMSAIGFEVSEYHLEAGIASIHASASNHEDTDWSTIVQLYDQLFTIRPSPIVALYRAIALGQFQGPIIGLKEVRGIFGAERLVNYPFYFAALGEFEQRLGQHKSAIEQFRRARDVSRNALERDFFDGQIRVLETICPQS